MLWSIGYTGRATLVLRATINNKISDWFRLYIMVAPNTKLLSQSGDTTICTGQPVSLNVSAEGYNLIYKWTKNGQVVQSGSS